MRRFSRYVLAIAQQGFRMSPDDAEDVFQEVFARTYERLGDLRSDEALRPWIAQLTRRLCIDRIRAGARGTADPAAIEQEGWTTPWTSSTRRCRCSEALEAMPDACREILDRFFRRDESYAVIGAALGIALRHHRQPHLPVPRENFANNSMEDNRRLPRHDECDVRRRANRRIAAGSSRRP